MTRKNSYHILENDSIIRVHSLSGQDTARTVLERMGKSLVFNRRFNAVAKTKDYIELESQKGMRLTFRIEKANA